MTKYYAGGVSAIALLTVAFTGNAHAAAEPAAEASVGIEEIVVTAQRREESLQKVPIAVTAFSSEAIESNRIFNVNEVAMRTPGFTFTERNKASQDLFIRGIGTAGIEGAAADPSIVTMVDDVYVGRLGAGATQYFDIERIEVLRGPQGTLYGKNAVGGVVNIATMKPKFDFESKIRAGYGNYNAFTLDGYVTDSISDNAAVKISGTMRTRDGFAHNVFFDRDVEDENTSALRGQLLVKPGDVTEILVSLYGSRDRDNGTARKPVGGAAGALALPGIRVNEARSLTFTNRDIYGGSVRIDHQFDFADFVSITGYRHVDLAINDDLTGAGLNVVPLRNANGESENDDQFSQEFRLSSKALNDRLFWVTGVYYLYENNKRTELTRNETGAPFNTPTYDAFNGSAQFDQTNKTNSIGVFFQGDYSLTDKLKFTAGIRYTQEKKEMTNHAFDLVNPFGGVSVTPLVYPYNVAGSKKWHAWTPRFALDFQATDSLLLYASASRGFKSGGYQAQAGTAEAAITPFNPEFAWSYETGFKSRMWENRVQFNVAAFYTDYSDLQVQQLIALTPTSIPTLITSNAANATSKGIETELVIRPTEWLDIFGNYSYLKTAYKGYIAPNGTDYSGNTLQRSPKHKFNIGGAITLPLGEVGSLRTQGNLSYQSAMFFNPDNLPINRESSYTLVDASMTYTSANEKWELSLWGKNLTNEVYWNSIINLFGTQFTTFAAPRTYGLSITYKMN